MADEMNSTDDDQLSAEDSRMLIDAIRDVEKDEAAAQSAGQCERED